jgi:hypothetical protein
VKGEEQREKEGKWGGGRERKREGGEERGRKGESWGEREHYM